MTENFVPYTSTRNGIAHFVETATCVGARSDNGKLEFLYCYGSSDLLEMVAHLIPSSKTPQRLTCSGTGSPKAMEAQVTQPTSLGNLIQVRLSD